MIDKFELIGWVSLFVIFVLEIFWIDAMYTEYVNTRNFMRWIARVDIEVRLKRIREARQNERLSL